MSNPVQLRRQPSLLLAIGVAASCFLVGLPVVMFLLHGHRKTPEDLQELFFKHESEFNQLAAVLTEEGRNIGVYRDSSAGESFPETHEYETLDAPTRTKLVGLIQRAGIHGSYLSCRVVGTSTRISILPDNSISNGIAMSYVFSKEEPGTIVEDLLVEQSQLADGVAIYRRLSGHWYLCSERLAFAD